MSGRLLNARPSTSKKDRRKPPYANNVESRCVHVKKWMAVGQWEMGGVVYVSPNGNGLYTVKWAPVRPRTLNGHHSTNLIYHIFVVAFPTLWHIHTYIYVHTYIYIHIFCICVCVFFYTLRLLFLLLLFQVFPYEFRCGLYIWYKCAFVQF